MHEHISLQGNTHSGQSWTAVAFPYLQRFAREWVRARAPLLVLREACTPPPFQFYGFSLVPADIPVREILQYMRYLQPRGREIATTASRVGAEVQPKGRAMPQLLPDGLSPDNHLVVAKATVHPTARPPTIPQWCDEAFAFQE